MSIKKAVVAGHICLDITPVFPEDSGKTDIGELLRPGRLIHVDRPDIHTGGAVANTGLAMKIMGADVRLFGKTGKDEFGMMVRSALDRYDAGADLIQDTGCATSYSIVLSPPGVDRIFLHCPGANDTFCSADIPDDIIKDAALFHFGYPALMKKMYQDNGKEMTEMFRHVSDMGIATSLDLAAADPDSEEGHADWEAILGYTLPYVDFFVPSFEELCFMLDRKHYEELIKKADGEDITKYLDLDKDILPLAEKSLKLGAKAVLLKCGKPGMLLKTSGRMKETGSRLGLNASLWNDFSKFETSYKIDKLLSATGAGDTSIAAFLTSILTGYGPEESVQNAAAAGALCCTAYDAVSGLEPLQLIRRRIESGWEKAFGDK